MSSPGERVATHIITATGARIPALGYGTWRMQGDTAYRGVRDALEVGYRHIDTAQLYANEREVGQALSDSLVPRDEVFLTTKVWRDHLDPDSIRRTTEESLARLGTGWVDLLLLHWPNAAFPIEPALDALMELQQAGKASFIGVSNYPVALLDRAVAVAPLTMNQVEYHCMLGQRAVQAACRAHGIGMTAYCPLGQGKLLRDPRVIALAAVQGVTPAQLALAWLLEQDGVAVIPKSRSRERIEENWGSLQVRLTDEVRMAMDAWPKDLRTVDPPAFGIEWDKD